MRGGNTSKIQRSHEQSQARSEERRSELAEFALQTLAERGYANTSLRDIAQNSPYSHGVMSYYFSSKIDLIVYCLRRNWQINIVKWADFFAGGPDPKTFPQEVGRLTAASLRANPAFQVLWYDLRTQAVYEPDLRQAVEEISESRLGLVREGLELYAAARSAQPAWSAPTTLALLDGLVYNAALRHSAGDPEALDWLEREVARFYELASLLPA